MLTEKQQQVVDLVTKRKNVMITGPGGTGKSFLIQHIISLKSTLLSDKSDIMGVTATTGAAAVLIRGTTLHSLLGIGLGVESAPQLLKKINSNNKIDFWKSLKILIIDEVSMLSLELFDKLEYIARIVRANEKPFGGIHLILSGDFLQLPCINGEFCFKSKQWKKCIPNVICIDEILRQTESKFHDILNRARFGKTTQQDVEYIKSECSQNFLDHTNQKCMIKPTMLQCKRADTDRINDNELRKIKNAHIYEFKKNVIWSDQPRDQRVLNALNYIPESISICVGAQVMLTVNLNIDEQLVNGSRGIVVGFCESFSKQKIPIVQFVEKKITVDLFEYSIENSHNIVVVKVLQIPLQLAYALTIHKSMGATLDCAHIDFTDVFAYGQGYVALSRIKSLKNLVVKNIQASSFKAHPEALRFYEKI